ncbi:DUF5999 family protein [Streptomyces sp. NPDC097617]|uniref:DUF5999 family protein n=1 Tax=Streptomyces sp. NPDC097617 TaxID=3366091 RepID=UPI0037FEC8CF
MCMHQPECPPAAASDRAAALVLASVPALGYSLLCNGVVLFEDSGALGPDGQVYPPHRPLPTVAGTAAKRTAPQPARRSVPALRVVCG